MKAFRLFVFSVFTGISLSCFAGPNDPLFVNVTTDEPHRITMALSFGKHHYDHGHPLSIFLSDKGVFVGVKSSTGKYSDQQKLLEEIIAKGGNVIMCPPCLKHYGFMPNDLLPGIKMDSPKITGDALFKDGTKTMSW